MLCYNIRVKGCDEDSSSFKLTSKRADGGVSSAGEETVNITSEPHPESLLAIKVCRFFTVIGNEDVCLYNRWYNRNLFSCPIMDGIFYI